MARLTSKSLRKALQENRQRSISATTAAPKLVAPPGKARAISDHCNAMVTLWSADISELDMAIDWSEARERCWLCGDKFSRSELKRGPLVRCVERDILACWQCEPIVESTFDGVLKKDEVDVFKRLSLANKQTVNRVLGPGCAGLYLSDRRGAYWIAKKLEEGNFELSGLGAEHIKLILRANPGVDIAALPFGFKRLIEMASKAEDI